MQLADHLHLDAGLRRGIVPVDVVRLEVVVKFVEIVEDPLATWPAARPTPKQRMVDRRGQLETAGIIWVGI